MNQDLEALASLYALDALDGEDLALFQKELAASEPLRALVREYRDTASALPLSLDPVEPSPALRSRVLASVAAPVRRSAPVFTRVFWAAAAIVLISLLIRSIGAPEQKLPWTGNCRGWLTFCGRTVEIDVSGLPPLAQGKVYQLWHIGPIQKPVPQGTFVCDGNGNYRGFDTMKYDIAKADAFAITMEPPGGSDAPTSAIFGIAKR